MSVLRLLIICFQAIMYVTADCYNDHVQQNKFVPRISEN